MRSDGPGADDLEAQVLLACLWELDILGQGLWWRLSAKERICTARSNFEVFHQS
jgi:hypothetical protein